jgi:hypothetical protein
VNLTCGCGLGRLTAGAGFGSALEALFPGIVSVAAGTPDTVSWEAEPVT